jgi:asparagine synthase (glutamine-hydrolysing)
MCGFAGLFESRSGAPADPERLGLMTRMLAHRGPDGDGFWFDGPVGLGHRRLAIIDLEGGVQPMTSGDGRLALVFNGEMYNYAEVAADLRSRGLTFRTKSDTEVLLEAWRVEGAACLDRFRGMFAFALWDRDSRTLHLVRDRLGVKPLYWANIDGRIVFGSEVKALLAHPELARAIDPASLALYLAHGFLPGDRAMLSAVRQVPPGGRLEFRAGEAPRPHTWWNFTGRSEEAAESADRAAREAPAGALAAGSGATRPHDDELLERLEAHLEDTVRLRMVSDVPVGAFLSGGIDSGLVVALMARRSASPVKTFSIGFDFEEFDERPYARLVAERFGADHEEFVVKADVAELLPRLVWHYDDPFADPSAIPMMRVAEIAARKVTVALSGDGGDESFGGYTRYRNALANAASDRYPAPLRALLGAAAAALPDTARGKNRLRWLSLTGDDRYADFFASTPPHLVARHLSREMAAALAASGRSAAGVRADLARDVFAGAPYADPLARMQYFDAKLYLPGDILVKVDRASMAYSLEAREPLLDHRVMEFGLSLPPHLRVDGRETKALLKRLARKLLPIEAVDRPKHGFSVPLDRWFRSDLKPLLHDVLRDPRTRSRGWLDPAGIERTLAEHDAGRARHGTTLWGLLMLELWARRFLDGPLDPPPAPPPRAEFLRGLISPTAS